MRVALIKIGALGDVVRTTALLPGLRRAHPAMELTWVTARGALPLIERHPDVRRAVAIDSGGGWRSENYDWVLSLDDDRASCEVASALATARLSGALVRPDGSLAYTADVGEWFGMGLLRSEGDGGLARANEIKKANRRSFGAILYDGLALPGPVAPPSVVLAEAVRTAARALVTSLAGGSGRRLVGLNTGAGGRWRFKAWGEASTAALARRIHDEDGADVLVLGGPAERERNARIVALAERSGVVAAPTDLDVALFAGVVACCDLLVSSDSLAMHLGVAAGIPVVAFFGPTSASEIDIGERGEKIVTPLTCRCCYLPDCDVRPHCMEAIPVERLLEAGSRWLD